MTLLKKGLVVAKADLQKTLRVLRVLGGENFLQETHR